MVVVVIALIFNVLGDLDNHKINACCGGLSSKVTYNLNVYVFWGSLVCY